MGMQRHLVGSAKVTVNHRLFVERYIASGNAANAYLSVFPNCKDPSAAAMQALRYPGVKALLSQLQQRLNEKAYVTLEWKVIKLKEITEKALTSNQYIDDNGVMHDSYDPQTAIRALAELNKMQGHYAPEKHVNVNIEGSIDKIRQTLIDYEKY